LDVTYDVLPGWDGMMTRTAIFAPCRGYMFCTAQFILSCAGNYREGMDYEIPCEMRVLLRSVRVYEKEVQMGVKVSSMPDERGALAYFLARKLGGVGDGGGTGD